MVLVVVLLLVVVVELSSSKSRSSSSSSSGGGLGMDLEMMGSLWKVPRPRRMRVKAVPLDSEWVDEMGIEIEDDSAVEALEVDSKEGEKSEMRGGEEGEEKRAMKDDGGERERESEIEGEFDTFYESLIEGWLIAGGEVDIVKDLVKRIRYGRGSVRWC
jgi:hypothetical protein